MKNEKINKLTILTVYAIMVVLLIVNAFYGQPPAVSSANMSFYTNIMESPTYVKSGFDLSTVSELPDASSGVWKQYADNKPRRIVDSGLDDLPKRAFLSPFDAKDAEFTITTIFDISSNKIDFLNENPMFIPGIFLGYIGENWEIYINGNLVKSEMHLDDKGNIKSSRVMRDVFFPVQSSLFKEGENVLCFRIVGSPTYTATGMYYSSPYYVGDYRYMDKQNNYMINFALCGIYFFLAIYHFMIFISVKKEKYNLHYSIITLLLGLYTLVRDPNFYSVFPNSDIVLRIESSSVMLIFAFMSSFIFSLRGRKNTLPTKIFLAFCSVCAVSIFLISSMQYGDDILSIWQYVTFPTAFLRF